MAKSHRFSRPENNIKRNRPDKNAYQRILIVCEGAKTEVQYFNAMRREKRLPNLTIKILHSELGTEPVQVVESAEVEFRKSNNFDKIYAVFDRDSHLSYSNALSKSNALNKKLKNDFRKPVEFKAIVSVPNFEFWILLHFQNILAFMHRTAVYTELKRPENYPTYSKNLRSVFADTKINLPVATERAVSLRNFFNCYSGTEPYTNVDQLVAEILAEHTRT